MRDCWKLLTLLPIFLFLVGCGSKQMSSVRKERKAIEIGNKLYAEGRIPEAMEKYAEAHDANPNSPEATFNLGVAQLAYAATLEAKGDTLATRYSDSGQTALAAVASMRDRALPLAAMACYNLGNLNFRNDKLDEAISLYIQSLRLTPGFPDAIRNLRIAQLKKEQNQDENKDKNQNNQDNNQQDQQDKEKNKDKDEDNKSKSDNNDNQQQEKQEKQEQQENITPQAASGILQSVENNEASARARLNNYEQRNERNKNINRKRW